MAHTIDPQLTAMKSDTDTPYLLREAVALFKDEKSLEEAILGLQEQGVDRARISVLGHLPTSADAGQTRNWTHHLVDLDSAPRAAPFERVSMAEAETAVIAVPGYGGAMAGLIAVMASGGTLALAIASAIVVGAAGGAGGHVISRIIDKAHREQIITQLEAGGLILWVTLRNDDEIVLALLQNLGGRNAHVSEHEAHWGAADVPLAAVQPDPLL